MADEADPGAATGRGRARGRRTGGEARRPRGTAKDWALRLLAVRWRSREELRRRLAVAGFDEEESCRALADLERVGLVEDDRFARELVRDQAGRRLSGDRAIAAALQRMGVDGKVADRALARAGDEAGRAVALARSRAPRLAHLGPDAAARRLYGFLLRRGYGHGVARHACRTALGEAFANPGPDADP